MKMLLIKKLNQSTEGKVLLKLLVGILVDAVVEALGEAVGCQAFAGKDLLKDFVLKAILLKAVC